VSRLQELAQSGDAQLGRFATGCLANMREAILAAAATQHWRQRTAHAAATVLQARSTALLPTQTQTRSPHPHSPTFSLLKNVLRASRHRQRCFLCAQAHVRRKRDTRVVQECREARKYRLPKPESPEQKLIRELRQEMEELRRDAGLPPAARVALSSTVDQSEIPDGGEPGVSQARADATQEQLLQEMRELRASQEKGWREQAEARWRAEWEQGQKDAETPAATVHDPTQEDAAKVRLSVTFCCGTRATPPQSSLFPATTHAPPSASHRVLSPSSPSGG